MQINTKDLEKSQREITVELSIEEFSPYISQGAQKVASQVKIEGFRPGKVPPEILKQKIGEMTILEEAANIAIRKTIDQVIKDSTTDRQAVGQPQVNVTKLAPNNALEYKVVLALLPSISLGKYKGLGLTAEEPVLSDEELDKALSQLAEMRAKEARVDRPARDGDKIVADVSLFLDKVPVENGEHKDLAVMLGKKYFVPGFDEQMIGLKKGEQKEFSLPYPESHHQKNLAGQTVSFKVMVKDVYGRELPAVNDEFAVGLGLKDLAELKNNFRENLLHEKKHKVDQKNEIQLLEKIIEGSKFGDLPAILIDSESKNMVAELEQSIVRQGGKFEDYLQHIKKDYNSLMLEMAPNAVKRVKSALLLKEVATAENVSVSEEEIDQKKEALKKQYADHPETLKMFEEEGYRSYLRNILTNAKVMARLKEWNYASTGTK